jgi:hypothetical protein
VQAGRRACAFCLDQRRRKEGEMMSQGGDETVVWLAGEVFPLGGGCTAEEFWGLEEPLRRAVVIATFACRAPTARRQLAREMEAEMRREYQDRGRYAAAIRRLHDILRLADLACARSMRGGMGV